MILTSGLYIAELGDYAPRESFFAVSGRLMVEG